MKSHWLRAAVVGAAIQMTAVGAFAADLPPALVYTKAPPAVAAYDWTGFYIGGNLGYSWGRADTETTDAIATSFLGFPFSANFAHSAGVSLDGVVGGGQIGYNWQASPSWVLGLEADWQVANEKARLSYNDPYFFLGPSMLSPNYETKISWFATIRSRIGYAWDRLLIYATGGAAYGQAKITGTMTDSGVGIGPFSATAPFAASRVNVGWTAGGGIEGALAKDWSWRAEYLYVDLGSLDVSAPGPFGIAPITAHAQFHDNIVRASLNFQFH